MPRTSNAETTPTSFAGRVPPHNYETEQLLLGSVLLDADVINSVVELIRPDDFYKKAHQLIFKAFIALFDAQVNVDVVSVGQHLNLNKQVEQVGGYSYVASLTESIVSGANALHYATIVKDLSNRRKILRVAAATSEDSYDTTINSSSIIEKAESELYNIASASIKNKPVPARDIVTITFAGIEERANQDDVITGVPTGYRGLDELLGGFQKSEFIVIGARPSIGKTALALSLLLNISVKRKIPAALFSLEMNNITIMQRLFSCESKIDATRIRRNKLRTSELSQLRVAVGNIYDAPLFLIDSTIITITEIKTLSRRLVEEHGVEIIFIDYIGLITSEHIEIPRHEQVAEISRAIKALANDLEIPVVALSQVARDSEGRQPTLSKIRESGSIEQDADVVLFLHAADTEDGKKNAMAFAAPEEHSDMQVGERDIKVIVAKQRNGPIGSLPFKFISKYVSFVEVDRTIDI